MVKNPEERRAYRKKWNEENKEKRKKYFSEYMALHPLKRKEYNKKYLEKHPEKKTKSMPYKPEYYEENKAKFREYNKKYRDKKRGGPPRVKKVKPIGGVHVNHQPKIKPEKVVKVKVVKEKKVKVEKLVQEKVYINKKSVWYVDEREFRYELLLSRGKGKLTTRAQAILILICQRVYRVLEKRIINSRHMDAYNTQYDIYTEGVLEVFSHWRNCNIDKYDILLPYFTEVFKRGCAKGFAFYVKKQKYAQKNDTIHWYSIDEAYENMAKKRGN